MHTKNTLDPARLPPYMTAKQVAVLLDVSAPTVRRMAANGEIPARKIGKKLWRFPKDELLASHRLEAT